MLKRYSVIMPAERESGVKDQRTVDSPFHAVELNLDYCLPRTRLGNGQIHMALFSLFSRFFDPFEKKG